MLYTTVELELLKGRELSARRKSWDKNMFIYRISSNELASGLKYGFGEYVGEPTFKSTIAFLNEENMIELGWVASVHDRNADDWEIIETEKTP